MELHEALTQITEIRLQMARTEVYRGFRSVPVAFTGALAIAAAWGQGAWIADPAEQVGAYLTLWIGTAVLGLGAAGFEMAARVRSARSGWTRQITGLMVEQFVPCLVAGGLVTFVVARCAPDALWMLPGLWQVFFSLGVFAACRLLPRATFGVGVFYLAAGLATLGFARDAHALSPWAMGVPFGVGQFLAAAVLHRALERDHAEL